MSASFATPGGSFLPVQVAQLQAPSPVPTPSSGFPTPQRHHAVGTPGAAHFSPFGGYSPRGTITLPRALRKMKGWMGRVVVFYFWWGGCI